MQALETLTYLDNPMTMIEVHDTMRAQPVGHCIYCGSQDRLTAEHIIPLALGGKYVLPASSCVGCARVTSEFERRVLRGFMYEARVAGNFPTRRVKDRPASLPLEIERSGVYRKMDIPSKMHPAFLHLPVLAPAGILVGRPPSTGVSVIGRETLTFGGDPHQIAALMGADALRHSSDWDISAFARLLAKMAYGLAVAQVGPIPREDVPILPLILGNADDASYWLGSAEFTLAIEAQKPTHAAGLIWVEDQGDPPTRLLLARLKLFAPSGATGFEVVVYKPGDTTIA